MKTICIYHKGCTDGFGAAWVVWQSFKARVVSGEKVGELEFYPANYGEELPDVDDKKVIIVDFSYKRPEMDLIIQKCHSLLVLDHHKTAEKELEGIFDNPKVSGVFDMEHSGAILAWKWFCPESPPPLLLQHIEDRDLWKFEMKGTKNIIAGLYSHPQEFELWNGFMGANSYWSLHEDGSAISRQHDKNVGALVRSSTLRMVLSGHNVPVANMPYMMASDAGHILAKGEPFSVTYWDFKDGRTFSLRSEESGLDVSEIAAEYGGGGHKHAAGFKVGFDELYDFLNNQPETNERD